jgi:hypothetical protein
VYVPASLVTVVVTTFVSTAVALTDTPGISAFELSLTVPLTDAKKPPWLYAGTDGKNTSSAIAAIARNLFIHYLPEKNGQAHGLSPFFYRSSSTELRAQLPRNNINVLSLSYRYVN